MRVTRFTVGENLVCGEAVRVVRWRITSKRTQPLILRAPSAFVCDCSLEVGRPARLHLNVDDHCNSHRICRVALGSSHSGEEAASLARAIYSHYGLKRQLALAARKRPGSRAHSHLAPRHRPHGQEPYSRSGFSRYASLLASASGPQTVHPRVCVPPRLATLGSVGMQGDGRRTRVEAHMLLASTRRLPSPMPRHMLLLPRLPSPVHAMCLPSPQRLSPQHEVAAKRPHKEARVHATAVNVFVCSGRRAARRAERATARTVPWATCTHHIHEAYAGGPHHPPPALRCAQKVRERRSRLRFSSRSSASA
jgi:hypothetical protein